MKRVETRPKNKNAQMGAPQTWMQEFIKTALFRATKNKTISIKSGEISSRDVSSDFKFN